MRLIREAMMRLTISYRSVTRLMSRYQINVQRSGLSLITSVSPSSLRQLRNVTRDYAYRQRGLEVDPLGTFEVWEWNGRCTPKLDPNPNSKRNCFNVIIAIKNNELC